MRLAPSHIDWILHTLRELLGPDVWVTLFGSRADEPSRGGNVDLVVDVLIKAPNLQAQDMHRAAEHCAVGL